MQFALEQALVEVCEAAQADRERREQEQERDDRWGKKWSEEGVGRGGDRADVLNVVIVARTLRYCASELGS